MRHLKSSGMAFSFYAVVCLLLMTVALVPANAAGGKETKNLSYRLPKSVVPVNYRLRFEPDLEKAYFAGRETILLEVKEPVDSILLNANELELGAGKLTSKATGEQTGLEPSFDRGKELITFRLKSPLPPGRYDLDLSFKGILNDKLCGFYKSTYKSAEGKTETIATTQMEPTDARRMFPCFDEPDFKATFNITTVIDPEFTAISNAAVADEKKAAGGRKVVEFARTMPMSTYLVTLIVGKLESTEPVEVNGIPIRVWSTPGKSNLGLYARSWAARLLPYFEKYFGIPYPGGKLDFIAIPDFESGAMENLGAITFRETLLLVDEKTSSTDTLQSVAGVIAHEMAHLWFGDLVTMKWWDDLWLNEAFATWMATKSVDKLMPEWHTWDSFGLSRAYAMKTDSLISTRPIHFPVSSPNEANEMFDEITYQKGASILRMLERYVSAETFRKGVNQYLNRFKYGNATTADLWAEIENASGMPVPEIMHGWVEQPGYPLITLNRKDDKLKMSQSRFLLNSPTHPPGKLIWFVPVGLRRMDTNKTVYELLKEPSGQVAFGSPESPFIANSGGCGYYRISYPDTMLKNISPLIQTDLGVAERLSLLSDLRALTVSGKRPITDYLNLTASYRTESDPSVISALVQQMYYLNEFVPESLRGNFELYVRASLKDIAERLGWQAGKNDSTLTKMARSRVLETLGTIGQDEPTIKRAQAEFASYLNDPDKVDPDLMNAITSIVAYNGDRNDFQEIETLWKTAKTPEIEDRNLMALGSFREEKLISSCLKLCLSDSVRTQDSPHLLSQILSNNKGKKQGWQFIKNHWKELVDRYPQGMMPRVVGHLSSLTTKSDEADLKLFFEKHPVPAGKRAVARMLERVEVSVNFRRQAVPEFETWLSSYNH